MIDENTIRPLLEDLESDRVERTISVNNTDKFAEAICAFSNDFAQTRQPGYLIVGADDKSGTLARIQVTDQLLNNLAGIRSDGNVQPLPAMSVQKLALPEGDLAVVEVYPSDLPPVRYKGRVWIRVGPRRAIASEQEERILSERRVSNARTFDARPCYDSSISDLSIRLFEAYRGDAIAQEVIAENHRTVDEQLASLRFLDVHRGIPTNAGILMFGTNPRFFLSGAYIQYLQLPGQEITDIPVDARELSGDLQSVLQAILLRIQSANNRELYFKTSLQEGVRERYPEVALRELVLNAIIHRNYESNTPIRFSIFSDRIEIASPGGLYGDVQPENFRSQSSYRNPVIAEALKVLGFVNRYGYGIRRAERLLEENGNRPPEFVIGDHTVLVKIWAAGAK